MLGMIRSDLIVINHYLSLHHVLYLMMKNTGGLKDYNLLERLGDGSKPTAIIGDVADDLNLDLVVISMEAIHTKHIDANLLAEFIPCPVMLLPL